MSEEGAGAGRGDPGEGAAGGDAERVATALERVRTGVRQRQAELARAGGEPVHPALALLRRAQVLQEPLPGRPRSLPRRAVVFARKAVVRLFAGWYARPLLAQQNDVNGAVARLLEELVAGRVDDRDRLVARVAELEARLAALEAGRPPAGRP